MRGVSPPDLTPAAPDRSRAVVTASAGWAGRLPVGQKEVWSGCLVLVVGADVETQIIYAGNLVDWFISLRFWMLPLTQEMLTSHHQLANTWWTWASTELIIQTIMLLQTTYYANYFSAPNIEESVEE